MRIGLVVAGGMDESGRTHVTPSLLALVERLSAAHDVVVYVLRYHDRPRTYRLLGATIRDLGSPNGLRRQYAALKSAIEADGAPRILHAYLAMPAGIVTSLIGRRLRIPTVVTMDSGEFVALPAIDYGLQQHWPRRAAVFATARLASRVTVCSQYQAALARAHGVDARVLPLGVDTRIFYAPPSVANDGPPWRIVHVASLNRVKDQTTLLHAMERIARSSPDVRLDIIGEDRMNGAMQRLARRLRIEQRVAFHGWLPTDRVAAMYQQGHLNVISSLHEGACVAVLEAAACGVATVGTAVGHVADFAPDRAVAVECGSVEALASAIEDTLANGIGRRAMAAAVHAWATAHDADWSASEFEKLYWNVLEARGGVASSGTGKRPPDGEVPKN